MDARLDTKIIKVDPLHPDDGALMECAGALRIGKSVAFPTETVYGLGANALMPSAIDRVFSAKGRPQDNPLIVHVSRPEAVFPLAKDISEVALRLMNVFWPGPLTLLFPKSDLVPDRVTAGLSTVGIRMPDHPVAQRLLDLAGVPVAAPSANVSGSPSPTSAAAVIADLDGKVDYILDGGDAVIGLESTVLDVSGAVPKVLRPGGLSVEELEEVLGKVEVSRYEGRGAPPSPGMKYRHYAPKAEVYLATGDSAAQARSIALATVGSILSGGRPVILASSENMPGYGLITKAMGDRVAVIELGSRNDLSPVASRLFSALRHADSIVASVLLVESFPEEGIGLAVQDRLGRASAGRRLEPVRELRALLVCTGNTCRSPMAEAILTDEWNRLGAPYPLRAVSRGTSALAGLPATNEAVSAAGRYDIDLRSHCSAIVEKGDLEAADFAIAMTGSHKRALQERFPALAHKVYTLAEMVPEVIEGDIRDPIGLGQAMYDCTADTLRRGLGALASLLAQTGGNPVETRDR